MEVSMFTSFTDHMEMDDLSFNHNLPVGDSLEGIFEPSLVLTASENTIHQHEIINHGDDITSNNNSVWSNQNDKNNDYCHHYWKNINDNNKSNSYGKIIVDNNNHALTSHDDYGSNNLGSMLSFGNPSSCSKFPSDKILHSFDNTCNMTMGSRVANKQSKTTAFASMSSQEAANKDHILAERKRREKMNQGFIALSAIIPGLKKMDKASVLGDAIKYVKQLQEQVKTLEELTKKKTIESAVFVRRNILFEDNHNSSIIQDELSCIESLDCSYPEIEVRFSSKDVLIRIHCKKKNGVVEKLISDLENLHLAVINSSSFIFGCDSLDATVIAQMGTEFNMTVKDLVRHLQAALKRHEGSSS